MIMIIILLPYTCTCESSLSHSPRFNDLDIISFTTTIIKKKSKPENQNMHKKLNHPLFINVQPRFETELLNDCYY